MESIAVARASAKRDDGAAVGRFGVGFSAVLSVTDEPSIASRAGSVRWSRADAQAEVASIREVADELSARGGHVPVLRLPYPASAVPPDGFDTEVTLPLRDEIAAEAVRSQLAALDVTILLSLPALSEVVVRAGGVDRAVRREQVGSLVRLADGEWVTSWAVTSRSGAVDRSLLERQPVEQRSRDRWSVTVAVPLDAGERPVALGDIASVVRAPTPTDDPLTVPVVVIASYPLDATRRRVTPGALATAITEEVARAVVEVATSLPPHPSVLALVPGGIPAGEVDAELHAALRRELAAAAWLPSAVDPDDRLAPRDAVIVPDELVAAFADVVPGVLPPGWSGAALVSLGVRRPELPDLVAALGDVDRPPSWWRLLYDGLAAAIPAGPERDVLGSLPVPLAGGEMVTGPRGVVLADAADLDVDLGLLGLRVVHPAAAHPLLRSLGASEAGPNELLALPPVRAAVEASLDLDDPRPVADAVIALVAAAHADADEHPWLADLALPDDSGEWRAAGELLVPGGAMAGLVADDSGFAVVAADLVARWGAEPLVAVGVLDRPAVVRELDATGADHDLDDEESWWRSLPAGAAVPEFAAVRDLEQLRDDALGQVVALLAEPPLRDVLVEPATVLLADGSTLRTPSYTAWWLGRRPVLDGRVPRELRLPSADGCLHGLYDAASSELDAEVLVALGVIASLDDVDPDELLERLADPRRDVARDDLRALYAWVAQHHVDSPPSKVRGVDRGETVVVDASDAVVVDAPDLAPLVGGRVVLPVAAAFAAALAEQLDVPSAGELSTFEVVSTGRDDGDAVVHDRLMVRDADGTERNVPWRLLDDVLHVDAQRKAYGLGRGRAWREGDWASRHRRTEEAAGIESDLRAVEDDLDDV